MVHILTIILNKDNVNSFDTIIIIHYYTFNSVSYIAINESLYDHSTLTQSNVSELQ